MVSSLEPDLQILAQKSLRDGLIAYDRRYGWRGALGHISRAKIDPPNAFFDASRLITDFVITPEHEDTFQTLEKPSALHDWHLALIVSLNTSQAEIILQDGQRGQIFS